MSLDEVVPLIAKPFSPGNAFPADQVARERITFDKALIGSCTNGSYDDLPQAAPVIRNARAAGMTRAATVFVVFPGSGGVARQIEHPDSRLEANPLPRCFARLAARSANRGADRVSGGDRTRSSRPARNHLVQP